MNKTILLGTLLLAGVGASAQETAETPKLEVGVDYTYLRVNPANGLNAYNENGGSAYAEYNFNKVFGLVADLGGNYVGTTSGVALNNTSFDYLFGPRFNLRHSRYTFYAQSLFGGQRVTNGFASGSFNPLLAGDQNNFAAAFGGGVDIAVSNHIAVKPIQVEYLMSQYAPGSGYNLVQNNLRYSAGIVFRLGSK